MSCARSSDALVFRQTSQTWHATSNEEALNLDYISFLVLRINDISATREYQYAMQNLLMFSMNPRNCLLIVKNPYLSQSFINCTEDAARLTSTVQLLWYWSVDIDARKQLLRKFDNLCFHILQWMSMKTKSIELYYLCENLSLEESFRETFFCLGQSVLSNLIDNLTQSSSFERTINVENTELLVFLWNLSIECMAQRYLLSREDFISFLVTFLQSNCSTYPNCNQKAQLACFGLLRNLSSDKIFHSTLWYLTQEQLISLCEQYLSYHSSERQLHFSAIKSDSNISELILNILMLLNNLSEAIAAEFVASNTSNMFRPSVSSLSASLFLLYQQYTLTLSSDAMSIRVVNVIVSLIHKLSVYIDLFPMWIPAWYGLLIQLSSNDSFLNNNSKKKLWQKTLGAIVHNLLADNDFRVLINTAFNENTTIDDVISMQNHLLQELLPDDVSEECFSKRESWFLRVFSDTISFSALVLWIINAIYLSFSERVSVDLSETTRKTLYEIQSLSAKMIHILSQDMISYCECKNRKKIVDSRLLEFFFIRNQFAVQYCGYIRYMHYDNHCKCSHEHDCVGNRESFLSLLPCELTILNQLIFQLVKFLVNYLNTKDDNCDKSYGINICGGNRLYSNEIEHSDIYFSCAKVHLMMFWCKLLLSLPAENDDETVVLPQKAVIRVELQTQLLPLMTAYFTRKLEREYNQDIFYYMNQRKKTNTEDLMFLQEQNALCLLWVHLLMWQQMKYSVHSPSFSRCSIYSSNCDTATTPTMLVQKQNLYLARVLHETVSPLHQNPYKITPDSSHNKNNICALQLIVLSALQQYLDTTCHPCVPPVNRAPHLLSVTYLPFTSLLYLYYCAFLQANVHVIDSLTPIVGVSLLCRAMVHLLTPLVVTASTTSPTSDKVIIAAIGHHLYLTVSLLLLSLHHIKKQNNNDNDGEDEVNGANMPIKDVKALLPGVSRLLAVLETWNNGTDKFHKLNNSRDDTVDDLQVHFHPANIKIEILLACLLQRTQSLCILLRQPFLEDHDIVRHSSDTLVLWSLKKTADDKLASNDSNCVSLYSSSFPTSTSSFTSMHQNHSFKINPTNKKEIAHNGVASKKDETAVDLSTLENLCEELASWDRVSIATPDWSSCCIM